MSSVKTLLSQFMPILQLEFDQYGEMDFQS